ncbi:MAG: hypothetical protein RIR18_1898, partial [Pseudomonadota bacterium]
ADGQLLGTYCHGVLDHPDALSAILSWAGAGDNLQRVDFAARREADINRLADATEAAWDWEKMAALWGCGVD